MDGSGAGPGRETAWAAMLLAAGILGGCAGGPGPAATPLPWERIDPDPTGPSAPVAVVSWDAGYVGVGGGSAWATTDGRTWTAMGLPGAELIGGPTAIAASGEVVVAVGSDNQRATTWVSGDGSSWTRVDDPAFGPGPGYASTDVRAVAYGPSGFVAAGTEWGDTGQRAVAWHSKDGRSWDRAVTDLAGSGCRALVATDDGYVLAAADNARSPEFTRAMFWLSADGRTWQRATELPSFGNGEPQGMTSHARTIVAVGYRITAGGGGLGAMAWTSTDGRTWQDALDTPAMSWWPLPGPTPMTGQGAIQGSSMSGVAAAWGGFVAVGTHWGLNPAVGEGEQAMMIRSGIWRSADGTTWELVPNDLISVERDTSGTLASGLMGVMDVGGRPIAVGNEVGGNLALWSGPATTGDAAQE